MDLVERRAAEEAAKKALGEASAALEKATVELDAAKQRHEPQQATIADLQDRFDETGADADAAALSEAIASAQTSRLHVERAERLQSQAAEAERVASNAHVSARIERLRAEISYEGQIEAMAAHITKMAELSVQRITALLDLRGTIGALYNLQAELTDLEESIGEVGTGRLNHTPLDGIEGHLRRAIAAKSLEAFADQIPLGTKRLNVPRDLRGCLDFEFGGDWEAEIKRIHQAAEKAA